MILVSFFNYHFTSFNFTIFTKINPVFQSKYQMSFKQIKYFNFSTFLITLSVLLVLTIIEYFFPNIFFEEYESYFTTMLSGQLSPGTSYNHLYYFGQIGISFLYAYLYISVKFIPWIPIVYEVILSFCFAFFIKVHCNNIRKNLQVIFIFLSLILIHEHFFLLNITRTSFVLICLGGLILLKSTISCNQKRIAQCIVIFGILTRPEPAYLAIFLILIGDFLLVANVSFIERFKHWILNFYPVFLVMITLFIYFQIDFKTSNEFYKQIEPDVEYELMVRENFIPITKRSDTTFRARYAAVKEGFWGDSKLNDNLFLSSLIDKKGSNNSKILTNNFYTIRNLINKNKVIIGLLIFLYIISFFIAFKRSKLELLLVNLMIVSLFVTIIVVSIQVKMVDRGFVSLLTIICFIFILYLLNRLNEIKTNWIIIPVFLFSVFHINAVQKKIDILRLNVKHNKKCLNHLKPIIFGSNFIFLGQSSMDVFFHSQTPFGTQTNFKNIYIFNALAFVTIEPYRSYLEKKYKCNPNDYKAFFEFATTVNCIFLLNEEELSFLESYLRIVHKISVKFIKQNKKELKDTNGTTFYALKLKRL